MVSDKYDYVLTVSAENDIDEAYEYISAELSNQDAATSFADALEEKFEELCFTPKLGHIVENEYLKRNDIRMVHVKNFLVYYLIDDSEKRIVILNVVYNKRNQDDIFKNI